MSCALVIGTQLGGTSHCHLNCKGEHWTHFCPTEHGCSLQHVPWEFCPCCHCRHILTATMLSVHSDLVNGENLRALRAWAQSKQLHLLRYVLLTSKSRLCEVYTWGHSLDTSVSSYINSHTEAKVNIYFSLVPASCLVGARHRVYGSSRCEADQHNCFSVIKEFP
jgi:hypothetical protein